MATAATIKKNIAKLEAALKSKATPKSLKPKLETQLVKSKAELSGMNKGTKPKTSSTKSTQTALQKLKAMVNKNKKYKTYKGAGVDLEKDADRPALRTGKRVTDGTHYPYKKGNVYYEYRANRIDVKQPPKKYPKLEKGGYMAKGGTIPNNYEGKTEKEVWDSWNYDQKFHFLTDHYDSKSNPFGIKFKDLSDIADKSSYDELPNKILRPLSYHISEGQYAKGGYMAKGGISDKEVAESNAEMVLSQIKAVKHHAQELSNVVSKNSDIEAWVVAKIERASTDLSDITHYLEFQTKKMAMGGEIHRTQD